MTMMSNWSWSKKNPIEFHVSANIPHKKKTTTTTLPGVEVYYFFLCGAPWHLRRRWCWWWWWWVSPIRMLCCVCVCVCLIFNTCHCMPCFTSLDYLPCELRYVVTLKYRWGEVTLQKSQEFWFVLPHNLSRVSSILKRFCFFFSNLWRPLVFVKLF